jgi:signal transduction histidine kinase
MIWIDAEGMTEPIKSKFKGKSGILNNPHFWAIIIIIIALGVLYYIDLIVDIKETRWYWLWHLVIFEQNYKLHGLLFCIPFIYSALIFRWQGILVTWLISMAILAPRIYYYSIDALSAITNVVYLLIPLLIVLIITLQKRWRESEKKAFINKEEERKAYLAQILTAQEDERKRISREIHDDTTQRLWLVANQAQRLVNDKLRRLDPESAEELERIKDTILHISDDARRLSLALRPGILDDLGLVPAIRWLVTQISPEDNIEATITTEGPQRQIDHTFSTHLFRIAQEALSNIRRHAGATRVNITLQFNPETVKMTIQDNGKGFSTRDITNLSKQNKLGLIGLHERANLLNGVFKIDSKINKGTTLSVEFKD